MWPLPLARLAEINLLWIPLYHNQVLYILDRTAPGSEQARRAQKVIDRILYLEGVPNMQKLNPVRVGEDAVEQHKADLKLETDAVARYNKAIALCRDKGDNGTREILAEILRGEEKSIDWLESQLHIVEEIGKERYLAEQIHD